MSAATTNGKYTAQKSREEAEVDKIIEQLDSGVTATPVPAGVYAKQGETTNLEQKIRHKAGKRHLIAKEPGASVQYHNAKREAAITKNSRKSRNGYGRGLPKKGGAGGKGVWGKIGDEMAALEDDLRRETADEPDEEDVAEAMKEEITKPEKLREVLLPILNEYYNHAKTSEVIDFIMDSISIKPSIIHLAAHVAILASLDKSSSERELTSVLLAEFYDKVMVEEQYEAVFDQLLKEISDLILDYPDIVETLSKYIARCVADDCLAPKYVSSRQEEPVNQQAASVLTKAGVMITMNHGLVRLDDIWDVTGGIRPVKQLIRKMHYILKEYVNSSGDVMEALRCLEELRVPHFHHEFVYEAILLMMEDGTERVFELILKLLKEGSTESVLTVDQLETGFQRIYDDLADIVLDVPQAFSMTEKFAQKSQETGIISQDQLKSFPARGRKRYISENDGGRVKDNDDEFRQRIGSGAALIEEDDE